MGDLAHRPAEQVAPRVVEQIGQRLVGVDDSVVRQPDQRHPGRCRVEGLLEALPRLFERCGGPLPVVDVAQDHDRAVDLVAERDAADASGP